MQVMINDEFSWYRGKVAEVLDTREVVGVKVFWVRVGVSEFAIRESNTIAIPEIVNV
jgi:hypothetical protein